MLRGPTSVHDRIQLLDAIRGVALGGILLANLTSFFGADMIDRADRAAMDGGRYGETVLFAINWLVEGKFYSIFSMLLGTGFVLQLSRSVSQEAFGAFFRRRMAVLIGIGLAHMYGLWSGDILTLYGVMGLLLPSLFQLKPRIRAGVMAALFCVPLVAHIAINASDGAYNPRTPFAAIGADVRQQLGLADRGSLDTFARGTAVDYWKWSVSYAVARPGTYLQSGRPAKVLALFLLGAWLAASVLPRLAVLTRPLIATVSTGGLLGLIASFVYASIKAETGSTFILSSLGLQQTFAYAAGTTPLALAYMAAMALAWQRETTRRALEWFVPLGRMALSVYLTQTIIQVLVFTGAGLGLSGRLSLVWLPAVAAIILIAQRYACERWLRHHAQGPVEHLWRSLSYASTHRRGAPSTLR